MIDLYVPGVPAPQGSKRGYANAGRVRLVESSKALKPWRATIAAACHEAGIAGQRIDGPLRLALIFDMPRPKSHYGKRGLLPSAPAYPTSKPDGDKLARGVADALATDAAVIADDARIVSWRIDKRYADAPGVHITLTEVKE